MGFLHHEACPACGSRDNLARYADGSAWCFGCRYRERGDGRQGNPNVPKEAKQVSGPPADCGVDFSPTAMDWLRKYDVSIQEAINRKVRWSTSRQQLVFLFGNGIWQARNFHESAKTRYFTQGEVNDHLPIYFAASPDTLPVSVRNRGLLAVDGFPSSSVLFLVEDAVSAIKIARQFDAMPLLGSNISHKKLARIEKFYNSVVFWLDADKYKEAQGLSTSAKLVGLNSRVVYTERDPKEYDNAFILQKASESS